MRAAKIEAELKLDQILLHLLAGNAAMSAANAVLEMRPEAFNRVGMRLAVYPLLAAVVDRVVVVAEFAEVPIALEFIGADQGALGDVLLNDRHERLVLDVGDHLGH